MRRNAPPEGDGSVDAPDSDSRRRLLILLVVVALVGIPAGILRALCVGESCARPDDPSEADVPFCSLPEHMRDRIEAGYREDRSPDIITVGGETTAGRFPGLEDPGLTWPTVTDEEPERVPLVFGGVGFRAEGAIDGARLDAIAPTLARIIDLRRPHPEVRSGKALDIVADRSVPKLALIVVWKGVTSAELQAAPEKWPYLASLMEDGSGTLDADPGSLPADPAAVLTTIGTGGLPHQHGITGTFVRNDRGTLVRAWSKRAPVSVIAALGDDLDERMRQRPKIGLVGTDETDRGLIGGNWYIEVDRDLVAADVAPGRVESEALKMLGRGFGGDEVPDLMTVAARGAIEDLDRSLRTLVRAAERVSGDNVSVVVTATGGSSRDASVVPAAKIVAGVEERVDATAPVIEAVTPAGVFVNQRTLVREELSEDEVLQALFDVTEGGEAVVADAFPGLAVSFARYC